MKRLRVSSALYCALMCLAGPGTIFQANARNTAPPAKPVAPTVLETATKSAGKTQDDCMQFVQMNVFEFEECVSSRLKTKKLPPAERLGITYMGFVGALSAQRMGSQGSQQIAWNFGKQVQKVQKSLAVSDENLCSIVPGDCETRLTRTKLLLDGAAPLPLTEKELSSAHRH